MSSWIGSVGVTPIVVCVVARLSRITAVGASLRNTFTHLSLHFQTWTQSVCVLVSRVFASRVICVNSTVAHCCVAIVRCKRFAYFQIAASILCVDESCTWMHVS